MINRMVTVMTALEVIAGYYGIEDTELDYEMLDDKFDIKTRNIILTKNWYKNSALPMIIDYTAVIPDIFGNCRYYDKGKFIKINSKNYTKFGSNALCFYKGIGNGKITAGKVLGYIFSSITLKDKMAVILCSLLVTAMGLLMPIINYTVFNYIIPSGTFDDIFSLVFLFIGTICISVLSLIFQMTVISNVILKVSIYLQSALFSRLLRLKADFFKEKNSGELSDIIIQFTDISNIFSARSITAIINLILGFAYIIQMKTYMPELMPCVYTVTSVMLIIKLREFFMLLKWRKNYVGISSGLIGFVYELFSSMEKIRLNGAENRMFKRWNERYEKYLRKKNKPFELKYSAAISKAILLASTATIFLFGIKNDISVASFIAFNTAYGAFIAVFNEISEISESSAVFITALRLMKPIFNAYTETSDKKKKLEELKGNIAITNVRFKYAEDLPYVLDGISLSIKKGECIGITGGSGSGKSTLLRLILGFEEIKEGGIFIDNFDIREINLTSYRKNIGIVLQNSKLMNDDIYSNITISYPQATNDDVYEAVEKAGLSEDIDSMPMGLRTLVSDENSTISGGQKQRILIARAIIKKPAILIFDEATSALDNIAQKKVTEAVNKMKKTRIIIAHRLSTIKECDRIIFLKDGKIDEQGTYEELIALNGSFADMLSNQQI